MPYSRITNKLVAEEEMEYGSLQSVLDRFNKEMENQEDIETGLIFTFPGADLIASPNEYLIKEISAAEKTRHRT